MDLLWMILPVFVVCAEAQNLTEVRRDLGQDVTLNCSLTSDVFWYMEIHSQFRALIARCFSMNPNDTKYYVHTTVTAKYKAAGNTLVITNVTSEDFRLYFCSKSQDNTFKFAFRLITGAPITPSTNDNEANNHQQHPSELVVYSSFALYALLSFVIIGLLFTFPCLKRKNCSFRVNDPSPLTCENPETLETSQYSRCVYEEIQLPTYRTHLQAASRPELLRSTLPRHRHLGHLDGY